MPSTPTIRFDTDELARVRARLANLERRTLDEDDLPRACVLVPLCTRAGEPGVLFTKRTDTVGSHKGQVSFPGGRMDPEDKDEIDCALRELDEEIGVKRAGVEVLGLFHDVKSINGIHVTPVVGYLGPLDDLRGLTVSEREIDDVFVLSLAQLMDPAKREVRQLGLRKAPFFTAGPHMVWGLTAFILDEVMRQGLGLDVPPLE
jgi:nudix motif 8